jgi:prepilin-type N-terminal cleavage/methylation domain-containing protein
MEIPRKKCEIRKNNPFFRQNGFTIAELIISIFIISLISGMLLTNYGGSKRSAELRIIAQKLASDIRMMQNYSLSEKVNDQNDILPPGGWGLYFSTANKDRYIFFTDNDNGRDYDPTAVPTETYQTITLPKYIEICLINGSASANGTATFFPPDPTAYVNNSTSTSLVITLRETSNNSTSTVSLNPFGLINVSY